MELDQQKQDDTVFTNKKDYTISQIAEMIRDGEINPQPDYQREYVYDNKKASLLVESALMNIPIPIIYLSEEDDGTYEVIDGQQRIKSFFRYLNNDFALKLEPNSPFYHLNGLKFEKLEKSLQRKYKNSSLSVIVILKQSKDLKYDIFERLNQGAVSLKPQEIRNCIYRGSLNTMLKETVSENLKELSELFKNKNLHMEYEETILKFFMMMNYRNLKTPFNQELNKYMNAHKNDSESEIKQSKKLFLDTFRLVKQVLGTNAFKAYNNDRRTFDKNFNSAVYDSIMIPFSSFRRQDIINNANEIRIAINEVKKSSIYDTCIHRGTNSKIRTTTRIEQIYDAINSVIKKNSTNIFDNRYFSQEQKMELYYEGCKCGICGQAILDINDCEVDHIIPYSKGGRTIIENAQLVHSTCNKIKSNKVSADEDVEVESAI